MGPKTIYCPRYKHFKDTLVCRLNCSSSRRCRLFQEYLSTYRAELDERIDGYLALHPGRYDRKFFLEVVRIMKDELYMAIDADGKTQLMKREEILQQAEKGIRFRNIYRISHEMELRYQLVPKQDKESTARKSPSKPPAKP
jgi:hypothetical protein